MPLRLAAVLTAARPLAVHVRDAFLQKVADELSTLPEICPIGGVCRQVQREFFDPPNLDGADHMHAQPQPQRQRKQRRGHGTIHPRCRRNPLCL
jgi:hypothetical protein